MKVTIDRELQNFLPPLPTDEKQLLADSIVSEGCREPIVVWREEGVDSEPVVVDGHHRWMVCTSNGIEFDTVERQFADRNEAKLWMIENQNGRRNLSDWAKYEMAKVKREILRERGREKQAKTLKQGGQPPVLSESDKTGSAHNTQKEIAKDLNWSTGKVAQADKVEREADEGTKEKLRSGEITVNHAYESLREPEQSEDSREPAEEAIRPSSVTIPLEVEGAVNAILHWFSEDEREEIKAGISGG